MVTFSHFFFTTQSFHPIIWLFGKQLGMSAREYIRNFLKAVSSGRTDWENLTPSKLSLA